MQVYGRALLKIRKTDLQTQIDGLVDVQERPADLRPIRERTGFALYGLLLIVSVSLWFIAIRAPLWLDETVSFVIIKDGLSQIPTRQGQPKVPAYPVILWSWTQIAGTSELALRIPSILAMLGAVYFLYRAARELFNLEIAIIVAVVFCLHPFVILESIDARQYAFVMLATTSAIFALVRLRHSDSNWIAALFGFAAACIVWFSLLSIVILPAFAICFLL